MYQAIQTKQTAGIDFKSNIISYTIALPDWLNEEGELVKEGILEKVSKNFERA